MYVAQLQGNTKAHMLQRHTCELIVSCVQVSCELLAAWLNLLLAYLNTSPHCNYILVAIRR